MAAGARTITAAPLSSRSGAAADATRRRGARLLAEFRGRDAQTHEVLLFSGRDGRCAWTRSVKLRALYWEATMALLRVFGLVYVLWNC